MWIRNQDKTLLIKCDNFSIECYMKAKCFDIETIEISTGKHTTLGSYSTKEKALKVMDMIQKYIGGKTNYYITQDIVISDGYHVLDDLNIPMGYCKNGVFEMPADENVTWFTSLAEVE